MILVLEPEAVPPKGKVSRGAGVTDTPETPPAPLSRAGKTDPVTPLPARELARPRA
jgi:hypothetical protein